MRLAALFCMLTFQAQELRVDPYADQREGRLKHPTAEVGLGDLLQRNPRWIRGGVAVHNADASDRSRQPHRYPTARHRPRDRQHPVRSSATRRACSG
jgi:hypothetical protein